MKNYILFSISILIISLQSCKTEPKLVLEPKAYTKIIDTSLTYDINNLIIDNQANIFTNILAQSGKKNWETYSINNNTLVPFGNFKSLNLRTVIAVVNSNYNRIVQHSGFNELITFDLINNTWKTTSKQEIEIDDDFLMTKEIALSKDGSTLYLISRNTANDVKIALYNWVNNTWVKGSTRYITSYGYVSENSFKTTPNGTFWAQSLSKNANKNQHAIHCYNTKTLNKSVIDPDDIKINSNVFSISPDGDTIATFISDDKDNYTHNIQLFKYKKTSWIPTQLIALDNVTSAYNIKLIGNTTLFLQTKDAVFLYKFIDNKWQKYWQYTVEKNSIITSSISENESYIALSLYNKQLVFKLKTIM